MDSMVASGFFILEGAVRLVAEVFVGDEARLVVTTLASNRFFWGDTTGLVAVASDLGFRGDGVLALNDTTTTPSSFVWL